MSCPYTVTKGGAENVKATKNTTCWCKMFFGRFSPQKQKTISSYQKNLNHQHFVHFLTCLKIPQNVLARFPKCENNVHQKVEPSVNHQHLHSLPHNGIPRPHEVSPPISSSEATAVSVLLRIHGRLRLEEPLNHGFAAKLGCLVQRCVASGAAARGQAAGRTQRNEGEKNSGEHFGHLKSQSFGNCGHSKILPELQERCGFEDVLMTSSWLKRACEPRWQSKCFAETLKNVPSLRKQICGYACHWDKTEFEISPLR